MNIYSRKRRFAQAVKACVALCGLFWVFRMVTSPFLDVERRDVTNIGETTVAVHEWRADAAEWFPENQWVTDARKHFRDRGRYLFCNTFDLNQVNSQIEASPIALLWRTNADSIPIRLVADGASLKSSKQLLSDEAEIGSITGAKLVGNVVIRGPNNLWIKGDSFQFDKESMKLWSGSPVRFRYETHHGSASSGIEIQLNPTDIDDGQIDVTNVSKIQLLGTVVCDCSIPPSRRGEQSQDFSIRAPNGFSYNVLLKTAQFRGWQEKDVRQPLTTENSVTVTRKTPTGGEDRLVCPELGMDFGEEIDPQTGQPVADKIKLNLIQAWGRQVYFESPENEIKLLANRVRYFFDARRLEVETTAISGRDDLLRLKQKDSYVTLPPTQPGDPAQIQVLHMKDGKTVQRVEFLVPTSQRKSGSRPGRITSTVPAPESAKPSTATDLTLSAEWGESLLIQLAPDGESRIVKLSGGARVAEDSSSFGLTANTIAMKILGTEKLPDTTETKTAAVKTVSVSSPDKSVQSKPELDFSNLSLTPDVLTAVGDVLLESNQGSGRLRDTLTIEFEQVASLPEDAGSPKSPQNKKNDGRRLDQNLKENESFSFDADTLKAQIQITPDRKMSFRDLWLNGDVKVERKSMKANEAFAAFGNQLHAANGLMDRREIKLFGDPARVKNAAGEIEGLRIDLNEVAGSPNVVSVGSGSIRFETDRDLDGKKLDKPTPIDIYWTDQMQYGKQSANFVGNIRVTMVKENSQSLEVKCDGLTVHFPEDSAVRNRGDAGAFGVPGLDGSKGKKKADLVESIEFHNKVIVTIDQVTDGIPTGRHTATFADLVVNLISGDFNAIGPGVIESISPDEEGNKQGAPPVTARANSPAQTTETAFVYMQVEFIGQLIGNLHREEAELTQNVVAMVTQARHIDEEIDLQIVATEDLPERAGILRSEILSISSVEPMRKEAGRKSDRREAAFSMIARNNARLESRDITARADEIVYDHSKQQFIMKSESEGGVTVNHRSGPRGNFNRFNGKRCEYYSKTRELKLDRINGFEVNE